MYRLELYREGRKEGKKAIVVPLALLSDGRILLPQVGGVTPVALPFERAPRVAKAEEVGSPADTEAL
jgi:hypothetical protein